MTPKPADVSLPFKAPLGDRTQSLLLPHEMFASIYEHYPHAWTQNIIPDEETLGTFWDSVAAHPQMAGHPIAARPDFRSRCIPLGLHGDDVPITGLGKIWVSKMTQLSFFRCWRWVAARKTKCYGCTASSRSFALVLGNGAHCAPSFRCWLGRSYGSSARGVARSGLERASVPRLYKTELGLYGPLYPVYITHRQCLYTLCLYPVLCNVYG